VVKSGLSLIERPRAHFLAGLHLYLKCSGGLGIDGIKMQRVIRPWDISRQLRLHAGEIGCDED
jgi:hypothetical protein